MNNVSFFILNNTTEYYQEYSIKNLKEQVKISETYSDFQYFNPLYHGGDNNDFIYSCKFLYVHGVRMLEMPYDKYSYKYYTFPNNFVNFIKNAFLNKYYKSKATDLLNSTEKLVGNVKLLTPSEHSKYIFLSQKNFNREISVLPPFLNKPIHPEELRLDFNEPFILFLNADRWVKNSYRFLRAYDELIKQGKIKNIKLVMVGKPIFHEDFSDEVVYFDYLNRGNLEWLMKNALFLAYPSLNEGFGYPPVDCLKYNTPVLCTAISATNIVYNGSVVFVNPFNIDEIKSRILYMIDNLDHLKSQSLESKYFQIEQEINNKWMKLIS
ncbi:glycosyltransferase family 4 protein [Sphingobacterium kitahiroshimense]|nr:glycosyltransferase [Sphingobacterium sp. B16(2022)]NJI75004.1 glycosyltransferase family 4 protein [Sphingobacterium sp. B16(2022)]